MNIKTPLITTMGLMAVTAILSWPGAALAQAVGFHPDATKASFEEIRILSSTIDGTGIPDPKVMIISKEPTDVWETNATLDAFNSEAANPVFSTTGWHYHPGPSIVIVEQGIASLYQADDPTCTPVTVPAGTGFTEPGGTHVHRVRNETTGILKVRIIQMVPAGMPRAIPVPGQANPACPN